MGHWSLPRVEEGVLAPAPRGAHASVAWGSKVLVFGGADRSPVAFNDLWVLETAHDAFQWTRISPTMEPGCNLPPRSAATLTAIGDLVYLFGGQEPLSGLCFNDVKVLDPKTWHWRDAEVDGPSPPPRHSHCTGCLADSCLIVYGGAGMQSGALSDVWVFNPAQRSWSNPSVAGTPPAAREMHTGTMLDDARMLVFGGRGAEYKIFCDAAVLDAREMRWTALEPTPFSRCAHSAVLLPVAEEPAAQAGDGADAEASTSGSGSAVFVYGGYSGESVEGDILRIDPRTLEIELLRRGPRGTDKSGSVPAVRFAHSAVPVPAASGAGPPRMLVFGGVNPGQDMNDVVLWCSDEAAAGEPTPATNGGGTH